jgi:2-polyprenyl-3-methyl-5-hydroxy-6-metoxy-1,4-benzoquinol methylase
MLLESMDHFVKPVDSLSRLINEKAGLLYQKLWDLPLDEMNLPPYPLGYYKECHHKRKFFSVQTAAELLYRSIKLKGKEVKDLTIMDYGAGVGSLFLLAKMIGCKTVVYNDILDDMTEAARITSQFLNIPIDLFIANDHKGTIKELNEKGISCDIILSRNVIEHIYDLDDFYKEMAKGQPDAIIYFSTTANFQNPGMLWFHKRVHKRYELKYVPKRKEIIKEKIPAIAEAELAKAALATRGLAMYDLDEALEKYKQNGVLPDPDIHYTNTCDPENGLWGEHIIPVKEYRDIIESKGYKLTVLPAFWDTHYGNFFKNTVGKTMNFFTKILGTKGGLRTTAFIYIVAEKK